MKKTFLSISTFAVLFFIAGCDGCSKSSTSPSSTWYVGTTNHSGTTTTVTSPLTDVEANGSDNNSIKVYFANVPTTSGSYKIVSYDYLGTLANNEVAIETNTTTTDTYLSLGHDNVSANVTVSGGKINITIPNFWAQHANSNGPQADSIQINGMLTEY